MKKFTQGDNELLHRVYETHFADGAVGRKIAGDISRLIERRSKQVKKQAERLEKLEKVLLRVVERVNREAGRGTGIPADLLHDVNNYVVPLRLR
jgi:hypothetical protein